MRTDGVLRRGDILTVVLSGDYGKPRPAVVVQSDLFNEFHASVVVCPISSEVTGLHLFRLSVSPSNSNGLKAPSEIMVDKVSAVSRKRIGKRIGQLSERQISGLNDALRLWLDLSAEV